MPDSLTGRTPADREMWVQVPQRHTTQTDMKLREYKEALEEMIKDNPQILDMDVIYSTDAECNFFDTVDWEPSVGVYENHEFIERPHNRQDVGSNAVLLN